jgi:phytoene synthase
MAQATARSGLSSVMPEPAVIFAPPLPEVAWLVDAAGRAAPREGRTQTLLSILVDLKARDSRVGTGPQGA